MRTPLRRFPGADRAYKRVYARLAPEGTTVVSCQGIRICVDRRDVGVALFLLTEGIYEPYLTALFTTLLRPGAIVVDAGANIGYFSLIAARAVGDGGHVYAFEPEAHNFDLLSRSIRLNGFTNVTPVQKALSNRTGAAKLFLDPTNLGNLSLADQNVPAATETTDVDTISLDEFLATTPAKHRVDILKLDTQGAEGLVLAGASNVLQNQALKILLEFWPWGLKNLDTSPADLLTDLRSRGFTIKLIDEARGRVAPAADDVILAECKRREGGRNFVNLLLER
jgi:FkbM family methyltransferase